MRAEREEREESARPFNQSAAFADFEFWARQSYWTADEGLLLLFGRDPRRVSVSALEKTRFASPLARKFFDERQIVERAIVMKQIAKSNVPTFFLGWAERTGFEIPTELKRIIRERGEQIADWKTHVDSLHETIEGYKKIVDGKSQIIDQSRELYQALEREKEGYQKLIAALRDKCDALETRSQPESLGTRERNTLLKLVIGMAKGGYGFDPRQSRNPATADIVGDLNRLGLDVSADTVLKWLRAGADLLPRDTDGQD